MQIQAGELLRQINNPSDLKKLDEISINRARLECI